MSVAPLLITPGDPAGIGPEIVWKTLCDPRFRKLDYELICVGARGPFEKLGARIGEVSIRNGKLQFPPRSKAPQVLIIPAPSKSSRKSEFLPGFQSGWSIATATRLVQDGLASALVTGPISKERLKRGGFNFPGHTEFLAELCGVKQVTMMLANETLRISLVTTHLALKDVPKALTRENITQTVLHTYWHLKNWWGIKNPRIAIAALNPHAGESGLFGTEEIRLITPVIKALREKLKDTQLIGPLPADTLFAKHIMASKKDRFDAVVCMYHDQGLIPVKLVDFPHTVNITLGLPIVRTSVDHGVGFDIVGKRIADPSSLQAAILLAAHIVKKQTKERLSA